MFLNNKTCGKIIEKWERKSLRKFLLLLGILLISCTNAFGAKIPEAVKSYILEKVPQADIRFDGVIISDDMIMAGAAGFEPLQACERGIRAGLNMFIYRNSAPETIEIIESIAQRALQDEELRQNIEYSYKKIHDLKKKKNML